MLFSVVLVVFEDRMGVVGSRVGSTLGSSLGGTIRDGFSGALSSLASSGIRVGGKILDTEKVDIDSVLVDLVFLCDWRMCPFAVSLLFGRYFWTKSTVKPGKVAK